jgi:hypothetical protein
MATKYELATELRALTRGTKAGPICRMKKHELEAEIDRIKVMKQLKEALMLLNSKPTKLRPSRVKTLHTIGILPKNQQEVSLSYLKNMIHFGRMNMKS